MAALFLSVYLVSASFIPSVNGKRRQSSFIPLPFTQRPKGQNNCGFSGVTSFRHEITLEDLRSTRID